MESTLRYSQEGPSYFRDNSVNTIIYQDKDEITVDNNFANHNMEELQSYKSAFMYESISKKKVKVNIKASPTHTYLTSGRVVSRVFGLLEPTDVTLMWFPEKNLLRWHVIGRGVTSDDPIVLSSDEGDNENSGNVKSVQDEINGNENLVYGHDYEDFGDWEYGWSIIATEEIASGQNLLHIPKDITLKKLGMLQETITLIDDTGKDSKKYHSNIMTSKRSLVKKRIGGGWFEFINDHKVQVGDALLFTIWDPPTTLVVKLIRDYKFV